MYIKALRKKVKWRGGKKGFYISVPIGFKKKSVVKKHPKPTVKNADLLQK